MPSVINTGTGRQLEKAFHQRHAESYGFANEEEHTQLVNLRVVGIGKVDRPVLKQLDHAIGPVTRAIKGKREVYFSEAKGLIKIDLYDRSLLMSGDRFTGPAIIEQMDTTIVVPPEVEVEVEQSGNLVIHINPT
jgi:N-methylhydantoinase A